MNEKYVFVKAYTNDEGTIPQGSEITFLRGSYYLNGGLVMPSYQSLLAKLVNDENLSKEYLQKIRMIHNKL